MSLELNQHLGKQLRARRSSLGLTQTQVARAINVTFQQIQKYEKGTNGVSSSRLLQLANFLKVPIKYFFEEFKDFQNLDTQTKSENSLEAFVSKLSEVEKEKLLKAIPTIKPVKNEDLTRMASGYGYRSDPFTKARKFHRGMDFTAPRGTPVYATGNGVVKRADRRSSGYGRHVRINHGFGYTSLYAHLYKYVVKRGQKVKRGDLIGFVGSTGRSQAPHLHYEIIKDGKRVNPLNFYYGNLSPEEFAELLKVAGQENQSLD